METGPSSKRHGALFEDYYGSYPESKLTEPENLCSRVALSKVVSLAASPKGGQCQWVGLG